MSYDVENPTNKIYNERDKWKQRAEAAEAKCATLEIENAAVAEIAAARKAAEAEVARLREALEAQQKELESACEFLRGLCGRPISFDKAVGDLAQEQSEQQNPA